MKDTYIERHIKFVNRLNSNDKIRITKNNFLIDNSEDKIEMNTTIFSQETIKFFNQLEYAHIAWKYSPKFLGMTFLDEETDFVEGEFKSVKKAQLYSIIDIEKIKKDFELEFNFQSIGALYLFEEMKEEYLVCSIANTLDQLVFIDLQYSEVHIIKINVKTYLNFGYDNYFFCGWQKAVFLNSKLYQEKLRYYLSQLFPVYNFKIYKP